MKMQTQRLATLIDPAVSPLTLKPGRVLIVDDDAMNRRLLKDPLVVRGYVVDEAEDGEKALHAIQASPPDLLLLDVMMPVMDGFALCQRIRSSPATAAIPVLMVTALTDRKARLRGIEAGADDFLSKPIDVDEVLLRVHNAIFAKRLYDKVREDYEKLRELEGLREMFTHMLVHDLRSPLAAISGGVELLRMNASDKAEAESKEVADNAMAVVFSLTEMISSLLDVARLEEGKMPLHKASVDLRDPVRRAVEGLRGMAEMSNAPVTCSLPENRVATTCDAELVGRVVSNLLGNAIRYLAGGKGIRVVLEERLEGAYVAVIDNGPGIAPEYREKIFEKFGQVEDGKPRQKYSSGLGLTFCKLAVEAHGGRIGVESEVGKGSTFWFVIPA
jgi:signal transduction histidine kinase